MGRTIIALVDDMFFASKIRATAEALAVTIKFPRNPDALISATTELVPDLIVVDLHNQKFNPIDVVGQLKTKESLKGVPLLGFFSHVQTELQRQALEAGYDQVIPRSVFSRGLAKILSEGI
ncbi:MAG TPA: hypothetical protein DCK93_00905 [Blastocatellia bacterium]|nr:hypothetical protein [Blastocatellia bacterium]